MVVFIFLILSIVSKHPRKFFQTMFTNTEIILHTQKLSLSISPNSSDTSPLPPPNYSQPSRTVSYTQHFTLPSSSPHRLLLQSTTVPTIFLLTSPRTTHSFLFEKPQNPHSSPNQNFPASLEPLFTNPITTPSAIRNHSTFFPK